MDSSAQKQYGILIGAALCVLIGGAIFYHYIEDLTWIDSFYFCVVTLTTVGYGDITPKTELGRLFTTFYILIGVGIIATFVSALVKHQATKVEARRMRREKRRE